MIVKTVTTYISDDGKEFTNEYECMRHEVDSLCKEGFVKFYSKRKRIKEPIRKYYNDEDEFYNSVTRIKIDRSKSSKIRELRDKFVEYYGWCLFADVLDGIGEIYVWDDKLNNFKMVNEGL